MNNSRIIWISSWLDYAEAARPWAAWLVFSLSFSTAKNKRLATVGFRLIRFLHKTRHYYVVGRGSNCNQFGVSLYRHYGQHHHSWRWVFSSHHSWFSKKNFTDDFNARDMTPPPLRRIVEEKVRVHLAPSRAQKSDFFFISCYFSSLLVS